MTGPVFTAPDAPGAQLVLAFADDEFCIGMRHAQWIGIGPTLEEDLAFTSIAQDEIGHARALYGLLGDDVDAVALRREPAAYRSCAFVEDRCARWEDALVRHLLYDEAEAVRWEALVSSSVAVLADLARRALSEEAYHTMHARPLFARMANGTEESRHRVSTALARLLPLALSMFEPPAGQDAALAAGVVAVSAAEQCRRWQDQVEARCREAGLQVAWPVPSGLGGREGQRSDDFAELHQEMTKVYALDPAASW